MTFLINSLGGLVLGVFVGPVLYRYSRKLTRFLLLKFDKGIDAYIQDPELRLIIISKMLELQKQMKTGTGKKKMALVVQTIKNIIPGNIDDVIIEKICQGIYDEFIVARQI